MILDEWERAMERKLEELDELAARKPIKKVITIVIEGEREEVEYICYDLEDTLDCLFDNYPRRTAVTTQIEWK